MSVISYKCPCCGGAIVFDSTSAKLKCQYCNSEFDPEALKQYDEALKKGEQTDEYHWERPADEQVWQEGEADGIRVWTCRSCGGQVIAEETTSATQCPYCGNPIIVGAQLTGEWKPDIVIPFKVSKQLAIAALQNHYKGKPLLPKIFKTENHLQDVTGIYVPFWIYDCGITADVSYDATRVRTWSDSKFNHVETKHYLLTRGGTVAFRNIPEDGSKKMSDALMESLEPFDMKEAIPFSSAYLSGYLADKYDVTAEENKPRANARVKSSVEQLFARTTSSYTSVKVHSSTIRTDSGSVRYALLPVWILNTKYKDNIYTFAMNGQTGRLVGDLPIAWGKFFGLLFGIGAAIDAAIIAMSFLLL